ncbi:MAG: hypothetical protein JW976_01305 [Syntrophaceae bacterium]|nr:hypothetical protein [Syntrophaceae bacterium]
MAEMPGINRRRREGLYLLKGEHMKRFLTVAVIALLVAMPAASFAQTVITDEELNAITAEEGVSIDFTNMRVGGTTTLTSLSWGDTSGFTPGYNTAGYFGFRNIAVTGYLANIPSGTMNVDMGTNTGTSETKIFFVFPTITLGTANISGWLCGDRLATLDSTGYSQGGILGFTGFSTQVSGTMAVYAHGP